MPLGGYLDMVTPAVPLMAHFQGPDGKRVASLKVVAINPQGGPMVLFNNRVISAITINEPDFKFFSVEYAEEDGKPKLNKLLGKSDKAE